MKISNRIVKSFQEGGAVPAEDPAMEPAASPAPDAAPAEDPLMQLAELANQALQTQDCQAALALAEGFLGLVQGGAPAPAAAGPEAGAPVFRKGGKLVRRVKI